MKLNPLIPALLLTTAGLFAQEKGATPIVDPLTGDQTGITRAVVVGISDYQDPQIPDLQYAHKDALAFAAWLHTPAGGGVPTGNIRLLLNEKATLGQLYVALQWFLDETQEGDTVIFYFSGHGDMNANIIGQLGWLLCWDAPAPMFMAGALSVNVLQNFVTTLSVDRKARVWVVADACRAGKMADSEIMGARLTNANLLTQFAQETKVLSCQPTEYSIEGRQWGGGRGVFSYYLIEGLNGRADADADAVVTLAELGRYLEDQVMRDVAPLSQTPMTVGDKRTVLARVDTSLMRRPVPPADVESPAFSSAEPRGLTREILARADSGILQLYALFLSAIDSGHLMYPPGRSADDYFNTLVERPEMYPMQGSLKRTLAAALIDEGQTVVNKLLKTDPQTVDNIWKGYRYQLLPKYYERAAELLGDKHYIYKDLKTKEYYFLSKTVWLSQSDSSVVWKLGENRRLLEEALRFDSTAPYVYFDLAQTYPRYGINARQYLQKAIQLAPRWALAYYMLGSQYTASERIIPYYRKSIELDSGFLSPYCWIAGPYENMGRSDSAEFFRRLYAGKIQEKIRMDTSAITAYECNEAGNALWRLKRYDEAEQFLLLGKKISRGGYNVYGNLAALYTDRLEFEKAIEAFEELKKYSDRLEEYALAGMGDIYFYFLKDPEKAIQLYEAVREKSPAHQRRVIKAYYWSGNAEKAFPLAAALIAKYPFCINLYYGAEIALKLGMQDTAAVYFNKIIATAPDPELKRDFHQPPNYLFVALAYYRLGQYAQSDALLTKAQQELEGDPWLYFNLARAYAASDRPDAAVAALQQAVDAGWTPNPLGWVHGTLCDDMLNPLRVHEGFRELVRNRFPRYFELAAGK